jgi:hypothetical protein
VPLARLAVSALAASGQIYEAYANYDLGAALAQLGRCDEALPYLEQSRQLQGNRPEIRDAERLCRKGHGKGRGHGDGQSDEG